VNGRREHLVLPESPALEMSVSEFVALLNQTLEYAYPNVVITGELANLRISKNRWVYFDLKDELATVKFFGTVYQLPGPLEDGMLLKVRGQPRLHQLYGFSVNIMSIQPAGEGTIRRAAELLRTKLTSEGLFEESRKRSLPYPPTRIGLIASKQSAAYADFIKILNARWQGIIIELIDVQVQGEVAPAQIVAALEQFNAQAGTPDALVIIRGGGSAEDLAAFSTEQVTRAVAVSRAPTLVAIGHEIDLSLAELAADRRASTPSNAAELLVPDRAQVRAALQTTAGRLQQAGQRQLQLAHMYLQQQATKLEQSLTQLLNQAAIAVKNQAQLLDALNPQAILRRGYAIVRQDSRPVRSTRSLSAGGIVDVQISDGGFTATVKTINKIKGR
jgi:exodeoxyribonuclease VII large subunit